MTPADNTEPKRCFIYTRVSDDRTGNSLSPARQEAMCRQRADQKGYTVIRVFTEEGGQSAYGRKSGKRPQYLAMLKACRNREADVVMVDSTARAYRRVAELLGLVRILKSCGVVFDPADMPLDTSTPSGEMMYVNFGAMVQFQSAELARKIRDANIVGTKAGKSHMAGPRCFGYTKPAEPGGVYVAPTVVPAEAEAVRTIAAELLAGSSLRACAASLNDAGLTTTGGNAWTGSVLGQYLRSPRIAGLRTHTRVAAFDDLGNAIDGGPITDDSQLTTEVVAGGWEAIIPQDQWLALVAKLDGNTGHGNAKHEVAHLLTGLIVCHGCGAKLAAGRYHVGGRSEMRTRYECRNRGGNIRHSVGSLEALEDYVAGAWLNVITNAYLTPTDTCEATARDIPAEIAAVTADMKRINKLHLINHALSDAEWTDLHTDLARTLAELNSIRTAQLADTDTIEDEFVLVPSSREDVAAWWDAATLPERRTALRRIFQKIVLLPSARGSNTFDTARVQIHISGRYYALGAAAYEAGIMPEATDAEAADYQADSNRDAEGAV